MNKNIRSEEEQIEFFNLCLSLYQQAAEVLGEKKYFYDIAGTKVCLAFAGEALIPQMTPALAKLLIPPVENPDAFFCIWDSDSSNIKMAEPPCKWSDFTDRGDISGFNSKRIKTAFHWSDLSAVVMDLWRNTGVFWVQSPSKLPFWTRSAPLRTLFHWWMEKNNKQLLHAAAIGNEQEAVILTGKGGVGKSSTALKCLEYGMNYLSDDYVIVQAEPEPFVYHLYCSGKVKKKDVNLFPLFEKCLLPYIKNKEEKEVYLFYPEFSEKIPLKLPLKAIFTPEITEENETNISSVPFWQVQAAMSFTTLSHLPYAGRKTHEIISLLCRKLPSFKLKLGINRQFIPEIIHDFLKDSGKIQFEPKSIENEMPLISVVVPVYNGEKFIREAIDNIFSQNYPALEIIIVNDGSTDNSEQIISSLPYEVRYIKKENGGPASARNRGIAEASGDYIAFLDVDDFWPENMLKRLIAEFQEDPELKVVHGYGQLIEKDIKTGEWSFIGNPKEGFPGYIGAGLYKKEVFQEVGLYDTFLKFGEDADWFNRAYEMKIPLKKLDEVTLYVRRHGENMTEGKSLVELNVLQVFKKSLDRLRKQNPEIESAMDPEKVSVIIPCYNAEKYLEEAINSVLNQACKPLEIILIDDGSNDYSLEVAKKFSHKISIISQPHKGAAAARNLGINLAKGNYLAFLDADDVWEKHHLLSLLKAFGDNLSLDMALGHVEQFVSPEIAGAENLIIPDNLRIIAGGHPGAMLVKKDVFLKVGLLNENLEIGEFVDWFLRANEMNIKQTIIPEIIYKRRIHSTNQVILKKEFLKDYTRILKESIDRRKHDFGK